MALMTQWWSTTAKRLLPAAEKRLTFSSLSSSSSAGAAVNSPAGIPILCGRGDKKTKRGKRFKGSYGNWRPKKEKMIERIKDKVEVPRPRWRWLSKARKWHPFLGL